MKDGQIDRQTGIVWMQNRGAHEQKTEKNKAGYTATPVACGGQGLFLRSLDHLGRSSEAKDRKKQKKVKCDGPTDQRTDGPTDQRTDGPTDRQSGV